MERFGAIAKENLKYNMPVPSLVCTGILLISPLFVGLENLSEAETAKVLEFYLVFLGIILITPVFLAEQNRDLRDLITSKYTSVAAVYTIRILQAVLLIMILLGIYMAVMQAGNCDFEFLKMYFGAFSGMIFLGGMGVLTYAFTDQVVIGYMLPILYYILNVAAGYEKMRAFYLFSMSAGKYQWKWCLAVLGTVMLAAGIVIRVRRK